MDDDRTRVFGAPPAPPPGSAPAGSAGGANTLPAGTRLAEFEIVDLVGEGGFGIVYLALDRSLGRRVALKEYMPSALASRTADGGVSVKSGRHRETFEAGLRSFVTEAQILARFDHPSMVKVYRFWEERGTAYMAMPYYAGRTLKAALSELGGPPDRGWLDRLLVPVLDALECLHAERCLHRDVAPDNILLLDADQRPVLLDFGAARQVIGDMTQALTVILKPGYAPIEQYAEIPDMEQGPWTDVYALAAVVYYCIGGRTPPPSVSRIVNDTLVPARELGRGRFDDRLLAAVDAALAVRPEHRIRSIAEFRQALYGTASPLAGATGLFAPGAGRPGAGASPAGLEPLIVGIAPPGPGSAAAPTDPLGLGTPAEPPRSQPQPRPQPQPQPQPQPPQPTQPPAAGRARWLLPLAGVAVVAIAAAVGVGLYSMNGPTGGRTAEPAPAPGPAPAPAPIAAPSPPPPPPAAPVGPPFSPSAVLDSIQAGADTARAVRVEAPSRPVRIDVDPIRFTVSSERAGHLYVLMAGTDATHFHQIFPNALDADNRIAANRPLALPRSSWRMTAGGPPGTNELIAIVSEHPRDFEAAGLRPGSPFAEFDVPTAEALWNDPAGRRDAFRGAVRCGDAAGCDPGYGAVRFAIREVPR